MNLVGEKFIRDSDNLNHHYSVKVTGQAWASFNNRHKHDCMCVIFQPYDSGGDCGPLRIMTKDDFTDSYKSISMEV